LSSLHVALCFGRLSMAARACFAQPLRALGRRETLVMLVGIATVPFWQDSDAARLIVGATAGFVATTVVHFRSWPT
jgi:hypothetical protein